MALVRYGGGVIQMSGSVAGNTYARNRYGNYMRARTKPVNPKSAYQVAIRGAMAVLVELWNDVSMVDLRAGWDTYADNVTMKNKLGESIKLSGFNHFIRSNATRQMHGHNLVLTAPGLFTLADPLGGFTLACTEDPQNFIVSFDTGGNWVDEHGSHVYVQMGIPQNPGVNFFGGPYKITKTFGGVAPGGCASPKDGPPSWPIVEGQRVWAAARVSRDDGRYSSVAYASCIVTLNGA